MKKLIALIMLCAVILCGCSGNEKLAGVYQAENMPSDMDTVILYKDGSCQYLEKNNAKWSVKGNDLTITIQHPDTYYVDVYFHVDLYIDDSGNICTLEAQGYRLREAAPNILSWEVFGWDNMVRVKVKSKDEMKQTRKVLAKLDNVAKAEEYILEGGKSRYVFTVADNCLIREMGNNDIIYVKK